MIRFWRKSLIYLLKRYYVDIEYNSIESLTNKYKFFRTKSKRTINYLAPSNKYIIIEEFQDELRDLKNISNEIKTRTFERTWNKWNEKWKTNKTKKQKNKKTKKNQGKTKLNMLDDKINDILEKLDVNLTTLDLRCLFCKKL